MPITGTQPGSVSRWCERITEATAIATANRAMMATKSRRCLRTARIYLAPAFEVEAAVAVVLLGADFAAAGPLRSGIGFV